MKKSRKKMLLSSIAMLLVALVALGSATFAWYISQATVTAETTKFSAAAAEGLVIRHTNADEWGTKVTDLKQATDLAPATCSYANIASLVRAGGGVGTNFTDGTLTNTLTEETTALANGKVGSFLYDSFYVASSSGASVKATLTLEASTVSGTYMNYLVFVGGTLKGIYTSDEAATKTGKVTSAKGVTPVTVSAVTAQDVTTLNNNVVDNDITCTPKGGDDTGVKIEIIAFADGFNSKCTNKLANTTDVPIKYSITKNA